MSEETRLSMLEGVVDILTPRVQQEQLHMDNTVCPECGNTNCLITVDDKTPFTEASILSKKLLVCEDCSCMFEPYTSIVIKSGTTPKSRIKTEKIMLGNYESLGVK
jgi:C4-type Zn-finger protein